MIAIQVVTERRDPISAGIRFVTRSWASHTEFVQTENGHTFGSRWRDGVRWRPASESRHYTYVEVFTHPYAQQALEWAITQEGKPYDLTAIFGILTDRNWRAEDSWFCSELIAAAFEHTTGPLFAMDTRLNRVFPGHIPMSLALTRFS